MAVEVSIIVPTLNEAENLPLLIPRIAAAMAGCRYEVLVVDDGSLDATPEVCTRLAAEFPLILHVRQKPTSGLSGAVLHGFGKAHGEIFVVMDADLQHPPEYLHNLMEPIRLGRAEFVIGSRYVRGAQIVDGWTLGRRLKSRVGTTLARPLCPRVSDPLSGFFALRREVWIRGRGFGPLGYKIGLEIIRRCHVNNVIEVPICFGRRAAGTSKLGLAEQWKYLRHITRLYKRCLSDRLGQYSRQSVAASGQTSRDATKPGARAVRGEPFQSRRQEATASHGIHLGRTTRSPQ